MMKIEGPAKRVRVYIGEADHWKGKALYAAIVERMRREGIAGATVFQGIMGFGANSRVHATHLLTLSEDLPVVIEIVDTEERIQLVLPILEEMVSEGLITIDDVHVIKYTHSPKN
jgi:PII-like signaling protein